MLHFKGTMYFFNYEKYKTNHQLVFNYITQIANIIEALSTIMIINNFINYL
jgi:hypothetical protein